MNLAPSNRPQVLACFCGACSCPSFSFRCTREIWSYHATCSKLIWLLYLYKVQFCTSSPLLPDHVLTWYCIFLVQISNFFNQINRTMKIESELGFWQPHSKRFDNWIQQLCLIWFFKLLSHWIFECQFECSNANLVLN